MEKCIIAAVADNGAIGKDNDLLWHIAEDMKYFRRTTTGNPVVMGFRTFLSIGRPLPKRVNIVISTRSWADVPEGVIVARSLEEAYSLVEKAAKSKVNDAAVDVEVSEKKVAGSADGGRETEPGRIFIMGGGETYRKALPTADKLYITHVHTEIEDADTFFPVIDPAIWMVESETPSATDPETGYTYEFKVYKRRF
uniref:dihydrofolate reductase n=1 Tax=Candidatus Cryptobacteroides bacterium TaxID=3085639 RepID=UPI004027F716